jgi:hypothetical protein
MTRTAACGILAALISLVLQVVFLASLLPAVVLHGSAAGVDGGWWVSLLAAMLRTSLMTAIAATVGVALATLGRNTAFALILVFGWLAVFEGVVRGNKPEWGRFLWGDNMTIFVPWSDREAAIHRGPLTALVTIALYTAVFVIGAALVFRRRDIAGTS